MFPAKVGAWATDNITSVFKGINQNARRRLGRVMVFTFNFPKFMLNPELFPNELFYVCQ